MRPLMSPRKDRKCMYSLNLSTVQPYTSSPDILLASHNLYQTIAAVRLWSKDSIQKESYGSNRRLAL